MIKRQGASNLVEKLAVQSAISFEKFSVALSTQGQMWWSQLEALVGDEAWASLAPSEQVARTKDRHEYQFFRARDDKIRLPGHKELAPTRPRADSITQALLEVLQDGKSMREAQMCTIGANVSVSIDHCKTTGKKLSASWGCNIVNELGILVKQIATSSTSIHEIKEDLEALAERPKFKAKVVILDNLPVSIQ